jgi:small subunit ribosomal protein S3
MGHKGHPLGLRLGINKDWKSSWIASGKDFKKFLYEDVQIRKFLENKLRKGGVAEIIIERSANQIIITIHTSRPGIVIGRSGTGVEELKSEVEKITKSGIKINIQEVQTPEACACLVAQNIALQIEKRISWRRAVKQAISRALDVGVSGIRTSVAGRLGGVEMARTEKFSEGKMPLQTLKSNIDYAFCKARTTYGVIGVKVWIYQEKKKRKS